MMNMIYKSIIQVCIFYGMILKIISFFLNELSGYILNKMDTNFESTVKTAIHSRAAQARKRGGGSMLGEEDELDSAFSETGSVAAQSIRSKARFV